MNKIVRAICCLLISMNAFAQESTSSSTSSISTSSSAVAAPESTSTIKLSEQEKPADDKGFHAAMELSQNSNMIKADDKTNHEASTDLDILPSYKLNDKVSVGGRIILSKDQNYTGDTTVSDTTLRATYKNADLPNAVANSYTLSGYAPTSEESQETNRLQGAFGLSGKFVKDFNGSVKVTYSILARQNIHEFNINADGTPLVQYSLRHDLGFDLPINDKLTLSLAGYYRQGWTYRGTPRQTFGFSADLAYEIDKKWSASVGTSNEGNAFKNNGTDTNIKAYDDRTSTVKAAVTLSI